MIHGDKTRASKLTGCLTTMWRDGLENSKLSPDRIPRPNRVMMRPDKLIILKGIGLKAHEDFVQELISLKEVSSKFSKKAVEEVITDALFEIADTGPAEIRLSAEQALQRLERRLEESPIEWKTLFPISNLHMGVPEFSIGRVSFLGPDMLRTRKKEIEEIVGEVDREHKGQEFFESKSSLFNESCLAEVTVSAVDDTQAQNLAEQELQNSLSVLRFLFAPVYRDRRMFVDVKGRTWSTQFELATYSRPAKHVAVHQAIAGYFEPMQVSLEVVQSAPVKKLHETLSKSGDTRTELESRLVSALRTFASALGQADDRSAFLGMVSSLESFLLREHGPRKELLAERLAFVVGNSPADRRRIYWRFKDIYQLRSDVAHGRGTDVSSSDLFELTSIADACYLRALGLLDRFKTLAELLSWVEGQKFA